MYSFRRNAKVYLVTNEQQYNVDISTISFGQELDDSLQDVKTIQSQEMFAQTVVNAFKPATFEFTFPALRESDFRTIFDRALDYGVFDLYIKNKNDVFKIEGCIITNTVFIITKQQPLSLNLSGEASKLERIGNAGTPIPGTVVPRTGVRTYNRINIIDVILGGGPTFNAFTRVTIELQTNIKWTPFKTLDDVCLPEGELGYPTEFVVEKRILSGSLTGYDVADLIWDTDTTLFIDVGQEVSGTIYGFEFDLSNVSFTSRINTEDIYTQSYDWRLTQNPDALSEIITYKTQTDGDANAILDYWGAAILDSDNLPILDSF